MNNGGLLTKLINQQVGIWDDNEVAGKTNANTKPGYFSNGPPGFLFFLTVFFWAVFFWAVGIHFAPLRLSIGVVGYTIRKQGVDQSHVGLHRSSFHSHAPVRGTEVILQ